MEFPRFVYTSPGPDTCNGGTYGAELVNDEDEYNEAIAAGFFATVPKALEASKEKAQGPKEEKPAISEPKVMEPKEERTPKRGRKPRDA